jgi:hypothetical protein
MSRKWNGRRDNPARVRSLDWCVTGAGARRSRLGQQRRVPEGSARRVRGRRWRRCVNSPPAIWRRRKLPCLSTKSATRNPSLTNDMHARAERGSDMARTDEPDLKALIESYQQEWCPISKP